MLGERRVSSGRREMWGWVAVGFCALLLVVGVVVYLQQRADSKLAADATPALGHSQTSTTPNIKPGGTLGPAARSTAVTFIRTALARENLLTAWNLAAPELRSGVTKKQWLRGEMPFPPFPIGDLTTTGFDVVGSAPNEILLEVLLVPKLNSGYVPTRYEITLVRTGAKAPWKVSYFLPYAPPGRPTEPS